MQREASEKETHKIWNKYLFNIFLCLLDILRHCHPENPEYNIAKQGQRLLFAELALTVARVLLLNELSLSVSDALDFIALIT